MCFVKKRNFFELDTNHLSQLNKITKYIFAKFQTNQTNNIINLNIFGANSVGQLPQAED